MQRGVAVFSIAEYQRALALNPNDADIMAELVTPCSMPDQRRKG